MVPRPDRVADRVRLSGRKRAFVLVLSCLFPLLTLTAGGTGAIDGAAVEYAVIVSPGAPVRNLTMAELRRLFLFNQRTWSTGRPGKILLLEDDLRDGSYVLREIYRMDEAALRQYTLGKLYKGDIDRAPKVVRTPDVLLQYVETGQGLIAIVPVLDIGDAKVQILAVEGSRPGDAGYRLRD